MKTYSLSGWIENLGVVPLFLLAAFLFFPIFLSLSLLLHLVCIVLEAITLSLSMNSLFTIKSRQIFLYGLLFIVKGFYINNAIAKKIMDKNNSPKEHFISKGEQVELKFNNLDHFSVGNSEVISVKYRPEKKSFLIKGKSMGFSDLMIWQKNRKTSHKFYIISKKEQLKRAEIIKGLSLIGIKSKVVASVISSSGQVDSISKYKHLVKIKEQNPQISWNLELSKQTRNQIIADIYKTLYKNGPTFIRCDSIQLAIHCQYNGIISTDLKNILKEKYVVHFSKTNRSSAQNYLVDIKIIQIEHFKNQEIDLGVDQISAKIQDIINLDQFLKTQEITILKNRLKAKLIANPKTLVKLNEDFELSLGSEVPFSQTSNNGVNTSWKFAGLKFSGLLKEAHDGVLLKYKTNFTNTDGQNVQGTKGRGASFITSSKYIKVFEVTSNVSKSNSSSIPILDKIPIIKYFFSNNKNFIGHKQIIGLAKIRKQI